MLEGYIREPRQGVGEVIAYRDFEATTAFDHRDDCGYARSGLFAPDVDPVFSANRNGPHRILGEVGAELQFGVIEEADQPVPDAKCVAACLAGGALGQHGVAHRQDVSADLVQQRGSFLLAQSLAGDMVHVFAPSPGVDREQLVDQFHCADGATTARFT